MEILKSLLSVSYGEKFFLKKIKETPINLLNPFVLYKENLLDNKMMPRQDVIMAILQNEIIRDIEDKTPPKKKQLYFYLDENLKIKSRKNKNYLFDKFNFVFKNYYSSTEDITEENIKSFENVLKNIDISFTEETFSKKLNL